MHALCSVHVAYSHTKLGSHDSVGISLARHMKSAIIVRIYAGDMGLFKEPKFGLDLAILSKGVASLTAGMPHFPGRIGQIWRS